MSWLLKRLRIHDRRYSNAGPCALLSESIVPLLPYLLKAGEKAAEETGKAVAGQGWEWTRSLWTKLKPEVEAKPATLEAAQDVAHAREDEDAAKVREQLAAWREQTNP